MAARTPGGQRDATRPFFFSVSFLSRRARRTKRKKGFLQSIVYSWVARDVIIFKNPELKTHQSYYLYQAWEGITLCLLNNFSAQEHASSKNRHSLNFRVMAVRDIFDYQTNKHDQSQSRYNNISALGRIFVMIFWRPTCERRPFSPQGLPMNNLWSK